jgi:hypothetical protein
MNSIHKISIAKDFSTVPLGRFPDDSEFNGTTFREKFLLPALKISETVEVDLDCTEGYGSSFLEESFGGLVCISGFNNEELLKRIRLISKEDSTLIDEIQQYIKEARPVMTKKLATGH